MRLRTISIVSTIPYTWISLISFYYNLSKFTLFSCFQAAHTQSEKTDNFCRQLMNPSATKLLPEQTITTTTATTKPHNYIPGTGEQSAAVMYTHQVPITEEEITKSAAAEVAAKLTASTSSAEMLSYVLSSLASEGVIVNSTTESSSNNHPPEKRAKIETTDRHYQPPPPSSPPPPLPMPPMQAYPLPPFMVAVPYSYNQQAPPPLLGYPTVGPLINSGSSYTPAVVPPPPGGYHNYQMEGGYTSQPMAPMSRQ